MKTPQDIIKSLIRTEKSTAAEPQGKYLFLVSCAANKIEIKRAVEQLYKVKVSAVNTMINRGKIKRVRYQSGKTADTKRAIVTLKEGQKIEARPIMGITTFRPTTPSRRHMVSPDFREITRQRPEKSLLRPLPQSAGRNCYGRITIRHRGGRVKRMYRIIDFKRDILDVPGKVLSIEYDPNRSSRIALVVYNNQEKRYIIAPVGLAVGDEIIATKEKDAEIKAGNCLLLKNIPQGTLIHNIEMTKGRGGQIVRSAGSAAQIMAKEGAFAHVKLPSGEIRLINLECCATIGQVSNVDMMQLYSARPGRLAGEAEGRSPGGQQ